MFISSTETMSKYNNKAGKIKIVRHFAVDTKRVGVNYEPIGLTSSV